MVVTTKVSRTYLDGYAWRQAPRGDLTLKRSAGRAPATGLLVSVVVVQIAALVTETVDDCDAQLCT